MTTITSSQTFSFSTPGTAPDPNAPYTGSVFIVTLTLNETNPAGVVTEAANAFSLSGVFFLVLKGVGQFIFNGANDVSAAVNIQDSAKLSVAAAGALGSEYIYFGPGASPTLEALTDFIYGYSVTVSAGTSATLEAAAGKTLTLSGPFDAQGGGTTTLHIGSATDTGTVSLATAPGNISSPGTGFTSGVKLQIDGGALNVQPSLSLAGVSVSFNGNGGKLILNSTAAPAVVGTSAGSTGEVDLNSAQVAFSGGGNRVVFASGTDNVANLSNTAGLWDSVSAANGAKGVVNLSGSALARFAGAGATVNFTGGAGNAASFVNTGGVWADVFGANGAVGATYLTNAYARVTGGGETAYFWGGAANAVSLVNTGGVWDDVFTANGAAGTTYLSNARSRVTGANQKVYFWGGSGNAVSLVNSGGSWDDVSAANGAVGTVYLTNALARITGSGQPVYFWGGTGNAISIANTGGVWADVFGANGAVGTTYLTNASTRITGGGERAIFWGGTGNAVSLVNTGGVADDVSSANGAKGTVYLTNATARVSGGGETVAFWNGAASTVGLTGTNYALLFNLPAFGSDIVSGFNSSDTLSFNVVDQGKLAVTQSAGNTVISLDSSNAVTLAGYLGAVNLNYHV